MRVRCRPSVVLVLLGALDACAGTAGGPGNSETALGGPQDTVEAMRLFKANIAAIHQRDHARYLATYDHSAGLIRDGADGLRLGYDDWGGRTISRWPDTLIVREMRVAPVAPGVVYGSYRFCVVNQGKAEAGVAQRVFRRGRDGWRIVLTAGFAVAPRPASSPCDRG